jgi:hypothetical protein
MLEVVRLGDEDAFTLDPLLVCDAVIDIDESSPVMSVSTDERGGGWNLNEFYCMVGWLVIILSY